MFGELLTDVTPEADGTPTSPRLPCPCSSPFHNQGMNEMRPSLIGPTQIHYVLTANGDYGVTVGKNSANGKCQLVVGPVSFS
jgi:hypothetical protein